MLGYPVANSAKAGPRAVFMVKAGADFIHTQAGWEIIYLLIAKTALGLSKTLVRHAIKKKNKNPPLKKCQRFMWNEQGGFSMRVCWKPLNNYWGMFTGFPWVTGQVTVLRTCCDMDNKRPGDLSWMWLDTKNSEVHPRAPSYCGSSHKSLVYSWCHLCLSYNFCCNPTASVQ